MSVSVGILQESAKASAIARRRTEIGDFFNACMDEAGIEKPARRR